LHLSRLLSSLIQRADHYQKLWQEKAAEATGKAVQAT